MSAEIRVFLVHCKPGKGDEVFKKLYKMNWPTLYVSRISEDKMLIKYPKDRVDDLRKIDGVEKVERSEMFTIIV